MFSTSFSTISQLKKIKSTSAVLSINSILTLHIHRKTHFIKSYKQLYVLAAIKATQTPTLNITVPLTACEITSHLNQLSPKATLLPSPLPHELAPTLSSPVLYCYKFIQPHTWVQM